MAGEHGLKYFISLSHQFPLVEFWGLLFGWLVQVCEAEKVNYGCHPSLEIFVHSSLSPAKGALIALAPLI